MLENSNLESKININSFLFVLTIFSMPLTLPIDIYINSKISSILVVAILIASLVNDKKININTVFIILLIIIFFLTNYIIVEYKSIVLDFFIKAIRWGIIPMYIASKTINYKKVTKYWYYVGILNFIISQITLQESKIADKVNYMDFGICMTYSFIIFAIYVYKVNKNKIVNVILMGISFAQILVFGNRGSLLCCILLTLYLEIELFLKKGSRNYRSILYKTLRIIFIGTLGYIIIFKLEDILYTVVSILDSIQAESYGIKKIIIGLNQGIAASSSGRDIIYNEAINIAKKNSFFPMGVGYYTYATGKNYPHNILIDILITFGLPGLILFIIMFLGLSIRFFTKFKVYEIDSNIVISMFIYAFSRLILSSHMWQESMFWMGTMCILCKGKDMIVSSLGYKN